MEPIRKVYVVFKTHFDYGYTAMAKDIYERYMKVYIPAALTRAEEMRQSSKQRFIWTTGSWLITEFLRQADENDRQRMEKAIRDGNVRWHGLPFTTHTELMDKELFEYGLSLSQKLDQQFGMHTIAAKMTDVPGHTRAIIDPMADAGIRLLHLGDNPTSRAPELPEIFRWRSPAGKEIAVIYAMGYGQTAAIPGTGVMLYFAHTGDNAGPQSMEQIQQLYRQLEKDYPMAEIVAGTLEDIAAEVEKIWDTLPVITQEVGDTWIHGVSSDLKKISMYRALLRLRSTWDGIDRETVNRCLIRIPEHTWGSFIDPIINDRGLYGKKEFKAVRGEERYRFMEKTWEEQRQFVLEALEGLSAEHLRQAKEALAGCEAAREAAGTEVALNTVIRKNGWKIALNHSGAISCLEKNGRIIADARHLLGQFLYEVFSRDETDRFARDYIEARYHPNLESISWELFDKPGIQCNIDAYACATATLIALRETEDGLQADMEIHSDLIEKYGCPAQLTLDVHLGKTAELCYRWTNKDACRVPEGIWLGMQPASGTYLVRKLGEWIDPKDTVLYGNRRMCATDWGIRFADMSIESLDTAVLAFGKPALWNCDSEVAETENGAWFNLLNNMWNTNFPMWYEDDGLARFDISVDN